ncbi:MAG: tetratricopeptide repeat protein, partial [Chitinophagaceae bacterium]|nr:tetratricopeptide repeat protein [Chitinophagaceae bacterium]
QVNGYLYQAPITFYTQKGQWDLAPGFEKGANSRFSRKIEAECITCHNGYSKLIEGSINKYGEIPLGIDCERCHGPGSIHVAEKQAGNIVDTSKGPDYSIVNPRRMSTEQQNNLCQRCHLQGIAVLNEGKTFFDFKPSQKLSDAWHVFMPQYSQDDQHMIMASHVERMKQSECFVQSGKMSCITCHNPHVTVKATPVAQYNNACISCHQQKQGCTELATKRNAVQNNCVQCHMPKNGSIDIPHVAVTDHRIQKKLSTEKVNEIKRFIGLRCYNNDAVDAHTTAKGYLEFYERFEAQAPFLDSATNWLQRSKKNEQATRQERIRIRFLQKNYSAVCEEAKGIKPYEIKDPWTLYRIGESYFKTKQAQQAIAFLNESVKHLPYQLDFQLKLVHAYIQANHWTSAEKTAQFIVGENPQYAGAFAALGLIYMQKG